MLTAQDVKYSWERAADPKTGSTTAGTYLGDIVGVRDKLDGKASAISGVNVVDDRTLVVNLDGPKPYFLAKLTYPTSFVVDRENVESSLENWMFKSDASGPFVLHEYKEDEVISFERNTAYHTPPRLSYIAYLMNQAGTSLSYYQADEVDLMGLGATEAKEVSAQEHPLHGELQSVTSMCTAFIQINNTLPPMDDPNVRRAFALAVDKDRLIKLFGETTGLQAVSILPPAMPGYTAGMVKETFNAKTAREALAASKFAGKMPKITLSTAGYSDQPSEFLNALVDMWQKNLGVKVVVEYLDPRTFTQSAREHHGQLVDYGWCADYPDPENFLDILYHTGSEFNVSGYSNPEVDALLEKARTELDPAARLKLYNQAEALLLDDYATIPLMHHVFFTLVKPRVQGYVLTPMDTEELRLVWLKSP
jgi:oligopeptide transport system substrate-binding protein